MQLAKRVNLGNLWIKLRYEYDRLRNGDRRRVIVLVRRHYFPKALFIISFPLRLVLAVVLVSVLRALKSLVHIRFVRLHCYSLGGFATPQESYFCQGDAGMHPKRSLDIFHHYDYEHFNQALVRPVKPKDAVCNQQLDIMYKRKLHIFEAARGLESLVRMLPRAGNDFILSLDEGDPYRLFDRFPPHLTFTQEEDERGITLLSEMGLEPGSQFVCFHSRDGGYLYRARPRMVSVYGDWDRREQRNSSIDNYLVAAERLNDLGYYAIRMGKYVDDAINPASPRIIDYSTKYHSDFMDVYLSARCAFFLSQDSGLLGLPWIFRRPIALVNVFPLTSTYWATHRPNIFIPKLFYSEAEGRLLTFREILRSGLGSYYAGGKRGIEIQSQLGATLIENSPEEIEEVAIEMHQTLRSESETTRDDDELQSRFLSIVTTHKDVLMMTKGREQSLKIGTYFLRRHPELLD